MLELYGGVYRGWNVKHFHEQLVRDHGFRWGYTWVKAQLHTAGLVERAKRRGAHRPSDGGVHGHRSLRAITGTVAVASLSTRSNSHGGRQVNQIVPTTREDRLPADQGCCGLHVHARHYQQPQPGGGEKASTPSSSRGARVRLP
jgi:hypothetical protein